MAINLAALAGAGVPNIRSKVSSGSYGPVVPFRRNGGAGQLVNCINIAEVQPCASWLSLADLSTAFQGAYSPRTTGAFYQYAGSTHPSGSQYLAGVNPTADLDTYDMILNEIPVSMYNATCFEINTTGTYPALEQYFWRSTCFAEDRLFGNSSLPGTTWISGASCPGADGFTSIIEIAFAGDSIESTYAYQCDVNGFEGMGMTRKYSGSDTVIRGPDDKTTYNSLTPGEMNSTVTAFIAAIKSEVGLQGKTGPMGGSILLGISQPFTDNLLGLANAVSNAMAASAAYGYNAISHDVGKFYSYPAAFSSLSSVSAIQGYGWSKTPRSLGWSIVCIVIAIAWYAAAICMIRGGTRYNPTNWFQTMNTSAGSNLSQVQGTCTGAGLQGRKLKRTEIWYGELAPGHIGFAQQPTNVVNPAHKYGQVLPDLV